MNIYGPTPTPSTADVTRETILNDFLVELTEQLHFHIETNSQFGCNHNGFEPRNECYIAALDFMPTVTSFADNYGAAFAYENAPRG